MYEYFEIKDMQIHISLILLTSNVHLQIGKCTARGTCVRWYATHSQVDVEIEFGVVSLILLVYEFHLR